MIFICLLQPQAQLCSGLKLAFSRTIRNFNKGTEPKAK